MTEQTQTQTPQPREDPQVIFRKMQRNLAVCMGQRDQAMNQLADMTVRCEELGEAVQSLQAQLNAPRPDPVAPVPANRAERRAKKK